MGAVLAMVAVVTVVAGIATVTTSKLHGVFSKAVPKDVALQTMLDEWRSALKEQRAELIKLKTAEFDLLGFSVSENKTLLKAKNRCAGHLQTIYAEPVAYYIHQDYPKAKEPQQLTLILSAKHEFVYRTRGAATHITIDGKPFGVLENSKLSSNTSPEILATIAEQRDNRTVHIDKGERTIAILHKSGGGSEIAPRAFEFVDVQSDYDRTLVSVLTYKFLLDKT